jgi:tetratricopeptide (TPR) repeat protein
VAEEGPSASKARVLVQASRYFMLAGPTDAAVTLGREALAMAESLGLDDVRADALNNIGSARHFSGDPGGVADLEESIAIAKAADLPELGRAYNNLATVVEELGDVQRSRELRRQAAITAERFGKHRVARFSAAVLIFDDFNAGNWDAFVTKAREFLDESEQLGGSYQDAYFLATFARIAAARGEDASALAYLEQALALASEAGDPQVVAPLNAEAALIEVELGRLDAARGRASAFFEAVSGFPTGFTVSTTLALVARELGVEPDLRALVATAPVENRWAAVVRALLDGDFVTAAVRFRDLEALPSEAHARLRAAEQFRAVGRHAEAGEQLMPALAFFRSVGASRYVRRGEALLAATG